MSSAQRKIGAFLTAEEVPRWFGLSVVLIYLVGLGAVARFGIGAARREAIGRFGATADYAVASLVRELRGIHAGPKSDQERRLASRIALRDFATHIPAARLRLMDAAGVVRTSSDPAEVGTHLDAKDFATGFADRIEPENQRDASTGTWSRLYRGRIRSQSPSVGSGETGSVSDASKSEAAPAPSELFFEASVLMVSASGHAADWAGLFVVVFIVLGALFVVYRCLRQQMRSVSRIADRLRGQRDGIEDDLSALRIEDALDTTTEAWNEIVELAHGSVANNDRIRADEELSRALAKVKGGALSEVLNAHPDAMVFIAEEDRIEYANAVALKLFGWTLEDAKQQTVATARSTEIGEQVLALIRSAFDPEGPYQQLSEVVATAPKEGDDPDIFRAWVIPLRRQHSQGEALVIIRDITQQSRAETAREELIVQVAHELRTPLTNIRAYSETLSSGMFEDPAMITECYNVINKETRRLSRLIEDMLNVAQLEVGSVALGMDDVDLKTMLSDAVGDVRGLADEKNIDLQLILPSKVEPIRADRDKLAVVINNLLGNAIKYTHENGNVIVGCQVGAGGVSITVKDNGVGISEEDQPRVFEKFFRADDQEVQSETGTGIGLYTARAIAQRHGGDIELLSTRGEGSTFVLKLPHAATRATGLAIAEKE